MAEIVISEFMDEEAVARLADSFEVLYDKDLLQKPQDLAGALKDCRALIVRNKTQVRGALLESAHRLQIVGRLGVGLDNIDLEACRARDIQVIPATGANSVAVAEYVLACLLMLARGCYHASEDVAAGLWPRERMVGGEIFGKSLGLVGFGGIAREVAVRAGACGMRLLGHDPFLADDDEVWKKFCVTPMPLDTLLAESDAVSLHVPLTEQTRMLFDARRLAGLRKGALLVNTARGGIVDEEALAQALRSGQVGGAALDVFAAEPLAAHSPLAGAPNCILTAHIGGVTRESNVRVSSLVAEKVAHALKEAK